MNTSEEYFKWCVLCHLNPVTQKKKNAAGISDLKEKHTQLNFKDIAFPVKNEPIW